MSKLTPHHKAPHRGVSNRDTTFYIHRKKKKCRQRIPIDPKEESMYSSYKNPTTAPYFPFPRPMPLLPLVPAARFNPSCTTKLYKSLPIYCYFYITPLLPCRGKSLVGASIGAATPLLDSTLSPSVKIYYDKRGYYKSTLTVHIFIWHKSNQTLHLKYEIKF